jgi:hypothetical protein
VSNPKQSDKPHPSIFVHNSISNLIEAKKAHLNSADELDKQICIYQKGTEYYDFVDHDVFQTTPSGTATVDFLWALEQETARIRFNAEDAYREIVSLNSSTDAFGTVTNTAYQVVNKVDNFDFVGFNKVIKRPDKDAEYVQKFNRLDPELSRLYLQILEVKRRTTAHPGKSILSDVRQAYDHLIRILAPDKEVRAQPGWQPEDPQKPKTVTRSQRLIYAINKHITDPLRRQTMLSSTTHIIVVHDELNKLYHTEKPVSPDQAFVVAEEMIEILNQWIDVLRL